MNKKEFLDELEKKIRVLDKNEIRDILGEYSQHIDMRMESGLSEEEAIKDFGDMDELAAEILEAYHVDPGYDSAAKQDGIGKKAEALAGEITSTVKGPIKGFILKCKELVITFFLWIKGFIDNRRNGKQGNNFDNGITDSAEDINVSSASSGNGTYHSAKFMKETEKARRKAERIEINGIRKAEKAERRNEIRSEKRELKNMKKAARIASAGERREKRKGRCANIMGGIVSFCVSVVAIFCLIPVTIAAAFSVFGLGVSLIMLFGGYPLGGIFIALFGFTVAMAALWLFLASFIGRRHKKYLVREYVYNADDDFIKAAKKKGKSHINLEEYADTENEADVNEEREEETADSKNDDVTEETDEYNKSVETEDIQESRDQDINDNDLTDDDRRKRIAKEYLIEEGENEK